MNSTFCNKPRHSSPCSRIGCCQAREQVGRVHVGDDTIDVAVAHEIRRMGVLRDPRHDGRLFVVGEEVHDAVARRHGAFDRAGVELEDVLDDLLLVRVQHAGLGAGGCYRQDVGGRDLLVAPIGNAGDAHQEVRRSPEQPHGRQQEAHDPVHRSQHAHRERLRRRHCQAAGDEVGEHDEARSDRGKRKHEGKRLGARLRKHVGEHGGKQWGQCLLTHHAAQDGDHVLADLHHGEVVAGMLLHREDVLCARIALIRELAQSQTAG
jgi:hypothetical protein